MKKYIGALLFLLLLLTFGTVCAQSSGGCGENVSWELNDSVLSFTRKNESEDAIWNTNTGDSCKYVVKTSGATNVQIAGDGIKLGNGVDLFSDVCGEITELNLARLDTSEVTSLDNAFNGCAKVTQLNISGWATTKLTSVNSMFSGCSSLQVLDLSTLYLEGLSSWNGTFDNCTSINTFVFGANNKNIYGTLSDTIRTGAWYYKERSDVATDAYKIGTRVDAEGLFNNYVPSQMAGTWTTIAKAVTFDGNGDSNTKMGAQYFPSGLTLELKENEFKLEGYQFVNWNTAADGSGDTYTDCQKICPGTDLKLFAQWKIKNVTVSFIANGGEGTMAAQTVQADTATALNKNTFTRGGYIFTGWNTAADGSGTAYANGENITITDDLKLYAQWKDSTEAETKIESEDLDEVPDELADKFESVEQIETKMLLDLKVNGEPAQIDQTVFQDVLLMISFNEGKTWDVATEDNFPVGGLPITISYPDGTGPDTHNFSVSHMFTVTSERLRTTAGEIEYPEVSAESDGLHMILHGLSPVAIAWSLKETKIEAPEFSPKPAEGPFIGSLDVTITSETEGASIHYTTNGDTPTKDSALYEGPVKIEESCTIKAIAVKEGMPDSDVVSADFALSEPEPEPKPDHRPDFFRLWDDCELPATGFSSVRPTALSEQPKELRYEPVRMRLMLPTLDQDIELVTMPREGNSWTADWLGADAGILEGSALPGEGVSVIAAHNTLNDTQYGPFALLSTMETNDLIAVCSENGSLKIFRVYANELMRPDDMMRLAAFAGEEADPLVLVTCENESTEGGYLNRRVIFARPVR